MIIQRAFSSKPRPYEAIPEPPAPLEMTACYRYCEAMARARHHNFPVASWFVPKALRRHIWAVYAFARTADDFADEAAFEGRRALELDRWEEQLHAIYFGETATHPVFVALADTIRRYDLPITEFTALLQGFRTDLDVRRYATFADLRSYTSLAAEPGGHLMLYLGGYRDPELHRFADDLCTGLALAKLWQDILADLQRGRIYIPAEDMHHFGVGETDLHAKRASPALGDLVRYEVSRTRALFERARPLVDAIQAHLATELALVWHGGMQILSKTEAIGANILRQRPSLNALDKAVVVSRALAWRGKHAAQKRS